MIRRALFLAVALLALASSAFCQGARLDGIATVNVFGVQHVVANATIRVCSAGSTGSPCTPLASIYSNIALNVPLANPFNADANGNYYFFASPTVAYDIQISGTGIATITQTNVTMACATGCPGLSTNNAFTGNNTHSGTEIFNANAIVANAGITSAGPNTLSGGGSTTGAWADAGLHTFNAGLSSVGPNTLNGGGALAGAFSHSGSETFASLNSILYVGIAVGQYASLQAAHDILPSTGGTVFVTATALPFGLGTATLSITKPLHIIFDQGTFTYTSSAQAILCTSVNAPIIEGSGFQGGGSTGGTIISVTNTAANGFDFNTCPGAIIRNLTISLPGSGTGKGLIYTGNSGLIENVVEKGAGGNGCEENGTRGNSNGVRWVGVRCVSNGGIGLNVFGANANLNKFEEVEVSSNTGLGAQIATATNIFDPLHSFSNNSGGVGVSFISGASQNRGVLYSDLGTQTTDLAEAVGANNNQIGLLSGQNYTDAGTNNSSEMPRYLAPTASCATPSYSFQADNTTGFYDLGGGALGFCSAATSSFLFTLNSERMGANGTYNFSSNADPTAAGNDTGLSRPAAGLVAIGTGASGSRAGKITSALASSDGGTNCTNGELGLSAGWQSTGSATVTAVQGSGGQTCMWTITTGTTTAANPTVTDTLTTTLLSAGTVCEMNIHGGTHTAAAGEAFLQTGLSATAPVFTFQGTPTAGGTTYFVTRRCGP